VPESGPAVSRAHSLGHPELEFPGSGRRLAGRAAGLHERDQDLLADRAMGSVVIVVPAPSIQLFRRVGKGKESVGVWTFRPQPAVERIAEGVVGRLARPGEVERDAIGVGPEIEVARHELAALVDPDRLREAQLGADPVGRGLTSRPASSATTTSPSRLGLQAAQPDRAFLQPH